MAKRRFFEVYKDGEYVGIFNQTESAKLIKADRSTVVSILQSGRDWNGYTVKSSKETYTSMRDRDNAWAKEWDTVTANLRTQCGWV